MVLRPSGETTSPLTGFALACGGYSLFAIQDAAVKWLVAAYAVPQVLFLRSVVIVTLSSVLVRRYRHPSILVSPHRASLFLRAMLMLAAWLCYYSAARHLGLAEMTTLYFCAPLIVVALSIVVLGEKVGMMRWFACLAGFAGVVIAADPLEAPSLMPALLVLCAGFCWALSTIMLRLYGRTESTLNQMLATSLAFMLVCGPTLPFLWVWPDALGWGLMVGLGLVSAGGQYLLYESFRHAEASSLAPMEYTGLVWAFLYGYVIWAEVPSWNVILGAVLIVASSLTLIWWERRMVLADIRDRTPA